MYKFVTSVFLVAWLTGCKPEVPTDLPTSPTATMVLSGATMIPFLISSMPAHTDMPLPQLQVITTANAGELKLLKTLQIPGIQTGLLSQCSVAFSPDGKFLSGVCHQNTIPVWDAQSGQLIRSLESSPVQEVALAFSPDGKQIATGGLAGIIRVWDTSSGQMLWASNPLSSPVWELVFSPDGTKLASASFSRSSPAPAIHLWNPMNGDLLCEYQNDAEPLKTLSVDYAPDGKTLAYGTFDSVLVLDAELTTLTRSWTIPNHVGDLAFSVDGQFLATGSDDHKIRLWQTSNYELQSTLEEHHHYVNGVTFSPDSTLIVSGSHDQKVGIWDVERGQLLNMLEGHENAVLRVAINPEGTLIASISWDGTVRLWGVAQ